MIESFYSAQASLELKTLLSLLKLLGTAGLKCSFEGHERHCCKQERAEASNSFPQSLYGSCAVSPGGIEPE